MICIVVSRNFLFSKLHCIVANELNDSGRRKQSINTRDPWLVTGRNKPAVDNWLRELACNRR